MTEDPAFDASEGEHSLALPVAVCRYPVQALRPERVTQDIAPTGEMTEAAFRGACDEFVPGARATVER